MVFLFRQLITIGDSKVKKKTLPAKDTTNQPTNKQAKQKRKNLPKNKKPN